MGSVASLVLSPGTMIGLPFPASLQPLFLVCCLGGLRKIIYAFGLGYGLCMMTGGALTWVNTPETACSTSACGLYVAYGIRLVAFLVRRQASPAFNVSKHGKELNTRMEKTPLPAKGFVCLFVSLTQVATTYALQPVVHATRFPAAAWGGIGLSFAGLVLETVADEQKLAAKEANPDDPVMTGTYSLVRHPNYTGEILFWLGIVGAGQLALPVSAWWASRVQNAFGPLLMVWVMFGAAKRLDTAGLDKYKDNSTYREYASTTGSLFPRLF